MMKKVILIFVLLLSFSINNAFAKDPVPFDEFNGTRSYDQAVADNKADDAKQAEAARSVECQASGECIDKTSFVIDTSLFSIWGNNLKWYDSITTINNTLGNIIQKLMIALWVIALWVMSIWAWYMILYHGQDEYLSKWKNIFMGWITALVVALCSYYLVNLVWYILYK